MATNKPKLDWLSPLGAGLSLWTDYSVNLKSVSGKERVREAILGRLVDKVWYDPDYGVDLLGKLRTQNPTTYNSLASECEREILKDDRVEEADVSISYNENIDLVTVSVYCVLSDGESFDLIGSINLLTANSISFT